MFSGESAATRGGCWGAFRSDTATLVGGGLAWGVIVVPCGGGVRADGDGVSLRGQRSARDAWRIGRAVVRVGATVAVRVGSDAVNGGAVAACGSVFLVGRGLPRFGVGTGLCTVPSTFHGGSSVVSGDVAGDRGTRVVNAVAQAASTTIPATARFTRTAAPEASTSAIGTAATGWCSASPGGGCAPGATCDGAPWAAGGCRHANRSVFPATLESSAAARDGASTAARGGAAAGGVGASAACCTLSSVVGIPAAASGGASVQCSGESTVGGGAPRPTSGAWASAGEARSPDGGASPSGRRRAR